MLLSVAGTLLIAGLWRCIRSESLFIPRTDLVNQQAKRVVFVHSILREEYSLVVGLGNDKEAVVREYYLTVPASVSDQLANVICFCEDPERGSEQLEVIEKTGQGCPAEAGRCFAIQLKRPVSAEFPKTSLAVGMSYVQRYHPNPKQNHFMAALRVQYEMSPYFHTPYETLSQKTVLVMAENYSNINIKCPTPNDLNPTPAPTSHAHMPPSNQYICGVYNNIAPNSDEPNALTIHANVSQMPLYDFLKLHRTLEVSPTSSWIRVTEEQTIAHHGFQMKDEYFFRPELSIAMANKQGNHLQTNIVYMMPIAADAYEVKIRDEVGLITSRTHRRPSPIAPSVHILEITPRNPLNGGWSFSWTVSYYVPLASRLQDVLLPGLGKAVTRLQFPIYEPLLDLPIHDFKVSVIIPGEANVLTPLEVNPNAWITARDRKILPAPLRLGSQQMLSVSMRHLTREVHGPVTILYEMPWWAYYHRQLYFSVVVASILMIMYNFTSIMTNFSITPQDDKHKIMSLIEERRSMVQKTSSLEHLHQLDALHRSLHQFISKMDNIHGNALMRLYREQFELLVALHTGNSSSREMPIIMQKVSKTEELFVSSL